MNIAERVQRPEAAIPTASMADIAFLLIVFFMVTTVFTVDRTNVMLPATQERIQVLRGSAIISVTTDGEVRASDGKEMSVVIEPSNILLFAANLMQKNSEQAVVIKADRAVPYEIVDDVISQLRKARVTYIYFLTNQEAVN